MSETVYRCQGCAAPVSFNPEEQNLVCPYCGKTQELGNLVRPGRQEELDLLASLDRFESMGTTEVRIVKCAACGGESTFPPNIDSSTCDFCGTGIVVAGQTSKAMAPQYLLPFKVSLDKAGQLFRTWISKRWFAPSALKRLALVDKPLAGIYFPFWTYDASTHSWYQGERGDNYTVTVEGKDANGNRTTRTEVRTRWTPVAGRTQRMFDDILVPGSHGLPSHLSTGLGTWDLSALVEYNPAVLAGFKAETYSVGLRDGFEEAKKVMDNQIRQDVRQSIGGDQQRIHHVHTDYDELTFKYIQLPVWTLTYRFGKKYYQVLVNGQNGSIAGERPWSFWKILFLVLGILALGGGAVFLAYRMGWISG